MLIREAELQKRLDKKALLKIKDFIFNAIHKQRLTSHITNLFGKTYSKLLSLNPLKGEKRVGFRGRFRDFFSPLNLVALLLMDIGIAFLIWVGNLLWIDVSYWQKDIITALFASRTGEAISLGIGMTISHHLMIGATFFSVSVLLMKSHRIRGLKFREIAKTGGIRDRLSTLNIPVKIRKTRESRIFSGNFKRRKLLFVTIFALTAFTVLNAFLLNSIIGQTATKSSLQSYGSIRTVGVGIYKNGNCIETVSVVDWGMITPGQAITRTFYLKNEGNNDVTLTMLTTNWTPPAVAEYMDVTWDVEEGQFLEPDEVIAVTFTLSVDSSINGIETFSFGVDIIGSG